jgi:transposase
MGIQILTDLLNLTTWIVKEYKKDGHEIYLKIENKDYPTCPKCGQMQFKGIKERRDQIVEDLSIVDNRVFITFTKHKIKCKCGYSGNEKISFLNKYDRKTIRFQNRIYAFAKRMTGVDVGRLFSLDKGTVYRIDKIGIEEELKNQKDIPSTHISIDEISRKKGHVYATIIADPVRKIILGVEKGRKAIDIGNFFEKKGESWCKNIVSARMDAWRAFRNAVNKYCKNAIISFDHFHLAQHFSKAIDKLRINETKKAEKENKNAYKGTRWLLLKNPKNLKKKQKESLDNLLDLNQNLYKSYLLREEFREIFNGKTSDKRLEKLDNWIRKAKSIRIPEITEFTNKIIRWRPFVENALKENSSNSFSEGLNNKIRVIQRMAYGYKDFEYLRLKIIQQFNFRDLLSIYEI